MAHIIVIEDNVQSGRLAVKLLRRAGHEVTLTTTGEEGLTSSLSAQPDLVLIDMGLPDLDGQTVMALLRQQPQMANTALIAFTAWPEKSAQDMATAYGCDGVIFKPIDTRVFVQQVDSILRSRSKASPPSPGEESNS
ncbi:MAG TPA: response regulator [Aggregatilineales bacterium]|nr:response regulator [Aggregatilineales bacterium]